MPNSLNKRFVSVESDGYYLSAVRKKIARDVGDCSRTLIDIDIGITEMGSPSSSKRFQSDLPAGESTQQHPRGLWAKTTGQTSS